MAEPTIGGKPVSECFPPDFPYEVYHELIEETAENLAAFVVKHASRQQLHYFGPGTAMSIRRAFESFGFNSDLN